MTAKRWSHFLEPAIVGISAPLFWFPSLYAVPLALVLAIVVAFRRSPSGVAGWESPYRAPIAFLILTFPLTLLPVTDWSLAAPKIGGLFWGLLLVVSLSKIRVDIALAGSAVLSAVLTAAAVTSLIGLVATDWLEQKLLPIDFIYDRLPRLVQGIVRGTKAGGIHPNEIGGILSIFVPILVAAVVGLLAKRFPFARSSLAYGLAGSLGASLIVLALSQSRSAFAGTLLGTAIVITEWQWNRRSSGWLTRIAIVGFTGLFLGALFYRLSLTWTTTQNTSLDSLPARLELWERTLLMIGDFAFTGIGPGQFPIVIHRLFTPFLISSETYIAHSHQLYLQIAVDFGIPGAIAVVALWGQCCWMLARIIWSREVVEGRRVLATGLFAGLASFLVYGLTDTIALGARGAYGIWLVIGLTSLVHWASDIASRHPLNVSAESGSLFEKEAPSWVELDQERHRNPQQDSHRNRRWNRA